MFGLSKLLRAGEGRTVKRLAKIADQVMALDDEYSALTDEELKAKTVEFKDKIADGASLDDILLDAFATAREASWRVLGQKHFKVQIMGGAALHFGNVAEMKTGEGKTLTSVLPAYLNALSGKGVHIVTVNDYLAKRDAEMMGRVHHFLGLEVGVILSDMRPAERKNAYDADITYGTNNELGFDYLRDNMTRSVNDIVQRGHNYAIVDEVDSILIDEARTPLIISGPVDGSSQFYNVFAQLAPRMREGIHYEVDQRKRTVGISEEGVEFVEDQLGIDNLYAPEHSQLVSYLNNAIKAKELFERDKDYIIRQGEVMIVDGFTGRVLAGRRYNEGMHQAIEAKEQVEIKNENQTLATVTLQNYFRGYEKLAGMTGTAETEAAEFTSTYGLGVVVIPPNRERQRVDRNDVVYKNEKVKFDAVVDDIAERHAKGQPVLVGTTSVEKSEYLSTLLAKRGVRHEVLNAKNHAREAAIVAQAGRPGAVTVATNMAGRGTDIMLGGNAEFTAVARMQELGLDAAEDPEAYEARWPEVLAQAEAAVEDAHRAVIEAGGLYVVGTERHDSRRIDNQLRGRSGRQGDPGESRFYLSLTDELMRNFNPGVAQRIMNSPSIPDDMALEFGFVSKAIQNAQAQVEGRNAEQRKNVLKYDDVMNRQREAIYTDRRSILEGEDLQDRVRRFVEDAVGNIVDAATEEGHATDWDLDQLWRDLAELYPVGISQEDVLDEVGGRGRLKAEVLKRELVSDALLAYEDREAQVGSEALREAERRVVLATIGRRWQEHLYEMDYLKEGIGLRAMAQREPLVEYQREGYTMFQNMLAAIREDAVRTLFQAQISAAPAPTSLPGVKDARAVTMAPQISVEGIDAPQQPAQLRFTGPSEDGQSAVTRSGTDSGATVAAGTNRRSRRQAERRGRRG